jgi:hypothetical protein
MVITKALALVNETLLEDGTLNSTYLPRENGAKSETILNEKIQIQNERTEGICK